jgi:hypothetical protein
MPEIGKERDVGEGSFSTIKQKEGANFLTELVISSIYQQQLGFIQ